MLTSYLLANLILLSTIIICPFLGETTQVRESQTPELILLTSLPIVLSYVGSVLLSFVPSSFFFSYSPSKHLSFTQLGYNMEFKKFLEAWECL